MNDGTISLVARGRPHNLEPNMQVTTIVLRFKVIALENGDYELNRLEDTQWFYPTIFCRQLDHIQRYDDHLVVVNDNSNEEEMAIIDMHMNPNAMRKVIPGFKVHTEHRLKELKPFK